MMGLFSCQTKKREGSPGCLFRRDFFEAGFELGGIAGRLVRPPLIQRVSQDLFCVGFRARSEAVGLVHRAAFLTVCQMSETERPDKSPARADWMRGSRNASSSLIAPASFSSSQGRARDRKYSFSDLPANAAIAFSCRC